MKIIALEEHFVTPAIRSAWQRLDPSIRDRSVEVFSTPQIEHRLEDLDEVRIGLMDESGVDVQVLSLTTPGVQSLEAADAASLAHDANDLVAATVRRHPTRFEGFCALPMADPAAAVQELHRSVKGLGLKGAMLFGRTRDRNLDHPDFHPVLQAAAELGIPLYLHPQIPRNEVCDAYYTGLGEPMSTAFATLGWGWHMDAGIQAVRLILSGVFDRLPQLQVILGHWGEMVTFWLERLDALSSMAAHLEKRVADYIRSNFYVTPGGIFSPFYLARTLEVMGPQRLLFATDYPFQFAPAGGARNFITGSGLSQSTKAAFAHGNWERLTNCRFGAPPS